MRLKESVPIMNTNVLAKTSAVDSSASDFATFGAVHLDVSDAERSLRFWRDLIGLELLGRSADEVRLGVGGDELLVLHPGTAGPTPRGHSGLYHLAIHLPNVAEFARVVGRVAVARFPQAPTDHVMSLASYLSDPDGIGLELTLETPERVRSMTLTPAGPEVIDINGRRSDGREPIDLNALFAQLPDRDLDRPLPPGTKIGHVHLHVADLDAALAFYTDVLGFTPKMYASSMGAADMSAGGTFPHRLAINTWQKRGAPQRPSGTAGLRYFTVSLRSQSALAAALTRIEAAGQPSERHENGFFVRDPAGNLLLLDAGRSPSVTS